MQVNVCFGGMQAPLPAATLQGLITAVRHCKQRKDLAQASRLLSYLQQQHLQNHPDLGNYLVTMLVDCGMLPDAHGIFDVLVNPSEHSWTSLISGYIDNGDFQHAFHLYGRMQQETSIQPTRFTYLALLNACSRLQDVKCGRQIHVELVLRGLESELQVASTLVDTYIKCDLLEEARLLFDKLSIRDAISWTALITGYAERGLTKEAETCLQQMQQDGIAPDPFMFVCSLKACVSAEALETGLELHTDIVSKGLEMELYVGSALVDLYAKHGLLLEAQYAFHKLPVRNAVCWTVLIDGYAENGFSEEAQRSFVQMQQEGLCPDSVTFVSTLKACSSAGALDAGQELHAALVKQGLERELAVRTTLIDMYIKSGSLLEACHVFNWLPVRNTVSWNTLILGFVDHGRTEVVRSFYQQMQLEGLSPDSATFICSLKACSSRDVETGQELHAEITKRGFERELHLGNTLVDMYSKCGTCADACHVFHGLPARNTVSWDVLIAGYAEHGHVEEAWKCLHEMQLQGVSPDFVTFIFSLKACIMGASLEAGQELHTEITKRGLERELYVGNTLVDMYSKFALLVEACRVFDELPVQDTITWAALIAGYAKHGSDEELLDCFCEMQLKGVSAKTIAYIWSLRACGNIGVLDTGQKIHADVTMKGLERELPIGNTLVSMYAKCNSHVEAHKVFGELLVSDGVTWAALVAGYASVHALGEEVIHSFQTVQSEGMIFVSSLIACGNVCALDSGKEIHTELTKRGFEREPDVGNMLIDMYAKCGSLAEACQVFDGLQVCNAVSWNMLISGYAEHGLDDEVLNCYRKMQLKGVSADYATFVCSLMACGSRRALRLGQEIHAELTLKGFERELHISNKLVDMYMKCGLLAEACQVFTRLPVRDAFLWNSLIAGYIEHGFNEKVGMCFQDMQCEGISPDSVTLLCNLKACSAIGTLETGCEVHAEIVKRGFEREIDIGSTLVDMYTKCGFLADARHLFNQLPVRDVVSWAVLIAGFSGYGLAKDVEECMLQMQLEGVPLDAITCISSLKACGTTGHLGTGENIHNEILKLGLEEDTNLSSTLVNMYTKCGRFLEAHKVFDVLPVQDTLLWNSLISGYAEYGLDVEVLNCFKQMQLKEVPIDAITSIICLKACGRVGVLETGHKLDSEIRKLGLEKDPSVGNILIDMYGRCGSFVDACEVFDKLPIRDAVSWTSLLKAYSDNHEGNKAVLCFNDMLNQGVEPDVVTFTCLLAACSHASLVEKGEEYFGMMIERHDIKPSSDHYACMVDLYARSGKLYEAERFIAAMQCPPSSEILMALLSACKVYGRVDVGERCFQELLQMDLEDASAYLLMADMYTAAGRWTDAERMEQMRQYAEARKKPGVASVKVMEKLHDFVVAGKVRMDVLEFLGFLSLQSRDKGYVPNIDLILRPSFFQEKEAF